MIENFPRLQQPLESNSCLPTTVRAVLRWHGERLTATEASRLCGESDEGCDWDDALHELNQQYVADTLDGLNKSPLLSTM